MNPRLILVLAILPALVLTGCRKGNDSNKLIHGLPLAADEIIVPAQALQAFMILKERSLQVILPVTRRARLGRQFPADYPELQISGPATYTFNLTHPKTGTVTYEFHYLDASDAVIDPIADPTLAPNIKKIIVNGSGPTAQPTTFDESTTMEFETAGNMESTLLTIGSFDVEIGAYTINLTLPLPGAGTTTTGFRSGSVEMSGIGIDETTLTLSRGHQIDGPIEWDGRKGQIHLSRDTGFVITDNARVLIN